MGAAQIIYIVITVIGMLLIANKHGKPQGLVNFWVSCVSTGICIGLLIWGGFFD